MQTWIESILWLSAFISLVLFFAQIRLFSIDKSLRSILAELRRIGPGEGGDAGTKDDGELA